ncbi:MAG: DNA recombination protein RmuC, partial [Chloroflexi bacterium]|nr:DNA recombination protein RmuC [Chloroflexota bacterium]
LVLLVVAIVLLTAILLLQIRARTGGSPESLLALGQLRADLAHMRGQIDARREVEQRTADSIRRLELVLAGTQARGAAGENLLESAFASLPADWQVRDLRVGSRVVEFGLRLPNGLILPIDSKWAALPLLERFHAADEAEARRRLKAEIENTVRERAREVARYIDPNQTTAHAVATVPDAVYELCAGLHAELFRASVVLVPYSMFIPYLLLVFQTEVRSGRAIDLERLGGQLDMIEAALRAIQEEVHGRLARGLTMVENARAEIANQAGMATAALSGARERAAAERPDRD